MGDLNPSDKSTPHVYLLPNIAEVDESKPETVFDKYTEEMRCNETVKKEIMLGKRVGLYRIKSNLGNGNFSQVKLAVHLLTREEVAIKILDKTKLDAKTQRLLSREISSMERLHHPNVIRLYEVIEDFSKLHIVMEYASGGELHSMIVTQGKIPDPIAKIIFAQVVAAINHLHSKKVIHRDLKAENIFFAGGNKVENGHINGQKHGNSGDGSDISISRLLHVKLGDFGFSTVAESTDRLTTFCGSPPYAAPELFQAEWYHGPWVDIWAMGILLYFMLMGYMPFRGETVSILKKLILSGHFTCPGWLPSVSKQLIQNILKVEPNNRFNISQIMNHQWLSGQKFPNAYEPFKPTPSVPEIETVSRIDEQPESSIKYPESQERDDVEATKMLLRLGITDKHIEVAQAQTVRNYVTGTYRIMLHRVHRNRRMSHIPQSLSNPELGRRFFNKQHRNNHFLSVANSENRPRSKTSTRSDQGPQGTEKSSKMCNIL